MIRITDIHHYLRSWSLLFSNGTPFDYKINRAFIDISAGAFRTGNCHRISGLQYPGCISGADDTRQAKLAADDGAVTSAPAMLGDYRRGLFHDRLPGGIGHRGDQDVTALEL